MFLVAKTTAWKLIISVTKQRNYVEKANGKFHNNSWDKFHMLAVQCAVDRNTTYILNSTYWTHNFIQKQTLPHPAHTLTKYKLIQYCDRDKTREKNKNY